MAVRKHPSFRQFLADRGFFIVLALTFALFSVATDNFLSVGNVFGVIHSMTPLAVMSVGMALVVMTGKIDISVGSVAFLSTSIGVIAMRDYGFGPLAACALTLLVGVVCGAVNGVLVARFGVDPLITTLGSMIAFRGLGLQLTNSVMLQLPEATRASGNIAVGPVYLDILFGALVIVGFHYLHTRRPFGRVLTAIGNDVVAANKVGLPVDRVVFQSFVISGLMAAVAGTMTALQLGAVTAFLGQGAEFNALAVIVVGGISLTGGRGNLLVGIPLGAALFEFIRNGLTHLGAAPYSYRLVGGVVIFVAMYADAIRTKLLASRRKLIIDG